MSNLNFLSFCSIAALHDNHQKTVSSLGELSNKAQTYAKDPGYYQGSSSTSALVNFFGTSNDEFAMMPTEVSNRQLAVCDWLYNQAVAGAIVNDPAACMQLLRSQFSANITFSSVGTMVTNSKLWLPSHIEGTQTLTNGDTANFKIWFANTYFLAEYPYCEIYVALPLPDGEIDILATGNYQQIQDRLSQETPDKVEARVKALAGEYPYTDRVPYSFQVTDTVNDDKGQPAYFVVIAYGNTADAEDQIYTAIQEAILAVSKQPASVWEERVADLFNPLEFTCIPFWDRLGVENKTTASSQYSPVTDYETSLNHSQRYLPDVSDANLIKSTQFLSFLYKSINVAFVGKPSNHDGVIKLDSVYPDLGLIPSTDSQAAWMSSDTLEFLSDMEGLISGAEVLTVDGIPPTGVKRLVKNGVLYATRRIGKVKYSMITRSQFITDQIITR